MSFSKKNPLETAEAKIIRLTGWDLEFHFQRDRHRTVRISVKTDGSVHVRAPAGTGMDAVAAFLLARKNWIEAKRNFFLEHKGRDPVFEEGGIIWCRGMPYKIKAVPRKRGSKPVLLDGTLELPCDAFFAAQGGCPGELLRRSFLAWRHSYASEFFSRRVAQLDVYCRTVLGDSASFSGLSVKALKRRWGSCSAKGEICLASDLIALPDELIDLVILHELCHLRHMDHSRPFHDLLRRLAPAEKILSKKLRVWTLEHPRI